MSLSSEQLMLLMALADGELDGDERTEAEALAASNEDARFALETMRGPASSAVGEWVASSQLERASAAGAESIASAVMARVAKEKAPKVASLDAARARRDARVKASAIAVAMASIAAGAFFYFGGETSKPGVGPVASAPVNVQVSATVNVSAPNVPMPSPSALASADPPSQPDEVDDGPEVTIESSQNVTVFHVPASVGAAANTPGSVIVWIDTKPQGH
jgi:hypothetical protein